MAVNGFDFKIDSNGELVLDTQTGDLNKVSDDDLKIQLAYTRLKSCVNEWFYDEVGANLEELVGRAIKQDTISVGVQRITEVLTYDGLWNSDDIFVQTVIKNSTQVTYIVYFKLYSDNENNLGEETSKSLEVDLDLVKGVKIKYGWLNDNHYYVVG